MAKDMDAIRLEDGSFPAYAWPGGYPMYYVNRCGEVSCPKCMNEVNAEDMEQFGPFDYDANWENPDLYCDGCGERIPSAYAEEE